MYNENQLVAIKWNNTNREWYQSKGYSYTKRYDEFKVLAKDLPKGSSAKIIAVCDYCGKKYLTQNDILMKGRTIINKDCCPNCTGKKTSDVSRVRRAHKYYTKLLETCDDFGYTLITSEDEYTDLHMTVKYICPIHGEKESIFDNLMRGHGCIECSYDSRFDSTRHTSDEIANYINSQDGNLLLNPSDYKNAFTRNLRIKCKCGNEYITSYSNFKRANVTRCPVCSSKESVGEYQVRQFLEEHGIKYEQEKRFNDCCDKRSLPFDFFLPDCNICIEFDGKQHFEDLDGFGDFDIIRKHDNIKNNYCAEHNIKLIRIPYYSQSMINELLFKNINV